ncbi:MAG: tetratricopeptide repeat protein [Planctomycetota bacterium]
MKPGAKVAVFVALGALVGCANVQSVQPMATDYETCASPSWVAAQAALAKGDRVGARSLLLETLRACPDFVPAHLALIESARDGDGTVEKEVQQFYRDFPWRSATPVADLVRARLSRNDKERVESLEAALAKDPSFYFASLDLGAVWSANDRISKALASYESAVQAKPASWRANLGLARVLHQIGRSEDAAPSFARALNAMPVDAVERAAAAREFVALQLYELRDPKPAVVWIDELQKAAPQDVSLLMDRAAAHWLSRDRDQAAAVYRRVLEIEPSEFRAALCLGNLFFDRPNRSAEEKRRDWPRARLAYLYFLDHVDRADGPALGDGYDLLDRYVAVPCRLKMIDEAVGTRPADAPRPRLGDF